MRTGKARSQRRRRTGRNLDTVLDTDSLEEEAPLFPVFNTRLELALVLKLALPATTSGKRVLATLSLNGILLRLVGRSREVYVEQEWIVGEGSSALALLDNDSGNFLAAGRGWRHCKLI